MNAKNFQKLKKITKGLSVLYIEDNRFLQKKTSEFLNKLFDDVYQAYDGLDGYEKYKLYKPDIVITDLSLSKKNSIELIADMQQLNNDIKIIILSSLNDDFTLLQSIDMGIEHMFLKPLDLDMMISILIDIVNDIEKNNNFEDCLYNLNQLYDKSHQIGLINSYKGIPVISNGNIISVNEDDFTIQVTPLQLAAIEYERHTVINFYSKDHYIHAYVFKIDYRNKLITFIKPKYIDFIQREFEHKRIHPDNDFKLSVHFRNRSLDVDLIDISTVSIDIYLKDNNMNLTKNDTIDITMGFEVQRKMGSLQQGVFRKVYAKANIIRMYPSSHGFNIAASLDIKKTDLNDFGSYLKRMEINTIKELKKTAKKYQ